MAVSPRLHAAPPAGAVVHGSNLLVTEAGRRVVDLAEQAERCALGIQRIAASGDRVEGVVRVAVSAAFSGFVVKRLPVLRERHPLLTVEVLTAKVAHDLMRHEADLALRLSPATQPELVAKKLVPMGWSLYAAEGYLLRKRANDPPDDLTGHEIVSFEGALANVPGATWLREHAMGAQVVMRGTSILAVVSAVVAGIGASVIPCFLASAEATLRRLTPKVLGGRDLFLLVHPDMRKVPRVRVTHEFLVEIVEAVAATLRGDATARPARKRRA